MSEDSPQPLFKNKERFFLTDDYSKYDLYLRHWFEQKNSFYKYIPEQEKLMILAYLTKFLEKPGNMTEDRDAWHKVLNQYLYHAEKNASERNLTKENIQSIKDFINNEYAMYDFFLARAGDKLSASNAAARTRAHHFEKAENIEGFKKLLYGDALDQNGISSERTDYSKAQTQKTNTRMKSLEISKIKKNEFDEAWTSYTKREEHNEALFFKHHDDDDETETDEGEKEDEGIEETKEGKSSEETKEGKSSEDLEEIDLDPITDLDPKIPLDPEIQDQLKNVLLDLTPETMSPARSMLEESPERLSDEMKSILDSYRSIRGHLESINENIKYQNVFQDEFDQEAERSLLTSFYTKDQNLYEDSDVGTVSGGDVSGGGGGDVSGGGGGNGAGGNGAGGNGTGGVVTTDVAPTGAFDPLPPEQLKSLQLEHFGYAAKPETYSKLKSRGTTGYGQDNTRTQAVMPFSNAMKSIPKDANANLNLQFKQQIKNSGYFVGPYSVVDVSKQTDERASKQPEQEILQPAAKRYAKLNGKIVWIPFHVRAAQTFFQEADYSELASFVVEQDNQLKLSPPPKNLPGNMMVAIKTFRNNLTNMLGLNTAMPKFNSIEDRYAEWLELKQFGKAYARYCETSAGKYNTLSLFSGNLRDAISKAVSESAERLGLTKRKAPDDDKPSGVRGLDQYGKNQPLPLENMETNPFFLPPVNDVKRQRTTFSRFY